MRISAIAIFSLALVSCNAGNDVAGDTVTTKSARAEAALNVLVDKGFSGSVIVACKGEVVFNQSFALAPHSGDVVRYYVASVTKGITAIAVLNLIEQGELQLSDTVSKFFPNAPLDKRNITIQHLLSHGSGLPQNYAAEGIAEKYEAAESILSQPLDDQPGESFNYSNDGYSLLAIIIEIVSGRPYKEYVYATVMEPLGLMEIAFWPEEVRVGEHIPPLMSPYEPETTSLDWGFLGGHGARLSVDELYAITKGVMEEKLLNRSSRETMQQAHFTSRSGLGVGMGWFLETDSEGRNLRWMRGSDQNGGNGLSYVVGDADVVIVAMSNAGPDRPELRGWSQAAKDALLPIYAPVQNGAVQANCH